MRSIQIAAHGIETAGIAGVQFLAVAAVNILFLLIFLLALARKRNWSRTEKVCEWTMAAMMIPLFWAAITHFRLHQPIETSILPLLMASFILLDSLLGLLLNRHRGVMIFSVIHGLFFMSASLAMVFYAFSAGTTMGLVTFAIFTAAMLAVWQMLFSSRAQNKHCLQSDDLTEN